MLLRHSGSSAFLLHAPCVPRQTARKSICAVPRRKRRPRLTCAAEKLLVVELSEVLRGSGKRELGLFSERVRVDRERSKVTTYVLYCSVEGYEETMKMVEESGIVEGDALVVLEGTQIYQRGYQTPDPYWMKLIGKDWNAKPVQWAVETFFKEEVKGKEGGGEYEVVFEKRMKEGEEEGEREGEGEEEGEEEGERRGEGEGEGERERKREELCERIGGKLEEMGIRARVRERGRDVIVMAAAGSVVEAVEFCQMMLRIGEENTFVFGSDGLVESCVRGKGNMGICGKRSAEKWEGFGDRIFVSKEKGANALLDGVVYYAIF